MAINKFMYLEAKDEDLNQARTLVSAEYKKEGYINNVKIDSAKTYIAKRNGEVAGTVSIVFGNGLPSESLYFEEIENLRLSGKRVAEVCQLATLREGYSFIERNAILNGLFGMILNASKQHKIDNLVISINPKHEIFYAALGFEELGGLKHYPSVNAPALAKTLDLNKSMSPLLAFRF